MLSATLFAIGLVGVVVRRNMITVLMCVELMLNAVNINLVAFSHRLASLEGQIFAIFVIAIAAGEAAVGLAIIIQLYRAKSSINVDEARTLNG
ncbi:MAG: NADH-quinone oxidoreductase subunit NuoK [Thermoanaerobaculia bacterium]|nr:NADH-quinone oxidoreductase subunit NuoK [Thermoanaerobaculia bacterium]